ncbi:hypothetical protein ACQP2F_20090 [Actinoplanes sp. CA-030573]|uniref:hypothetical protein n=1 Tax=Actinoplanes sp. CA-030573 TaxID=3239898 RepID=UPI003D8BEF51
MLVSFVCVVGVLAAVRSWRARHLRPVACVGAMVVLAYGLAAALTLSSPHPRPFPYGVTVAFAVAFGVLLFLDRRLGLCLAAAAALAGVTRPGDVAAAVGVAALAAFGVFVSDRGASTVGSAGSPGSGADSGGKGGGAGTGRAGGSRGGAIGSGGAGGSDSGAGESAGGSDSGAGESAGGSDSGAGESAGVGRLRGAVPRSRPPKDRRTPAEQRHP